MDWCVDPSAHGARQAVEGDIAAYLTRRIPDRGAVEAAMRHVGSLLDHVLPAAPPYRLTISWDDAGAGTVTLRPLAGATSGAPLPGVAIGPGASACPWGPGSVGPLTSEREAVVLELGVVRPAEEPLDADVGPVRLPSGRDAFLTALGAMGSRLHGYRPEEASAFAGAAASHRAEEEYRAEAGLEGPLDARQVAEAFVAYQHSIGGDFQIDEASERHAVVSNRTCPFGDAVAGAPQLCRFTSAMLGSMAAESAGEATVSLDERLAVGDRRCRVTLRLGPTRPAGAHRYTWPPAGIAAAATAAVGGAQATGGAGLVAAGLEAGGLGAGGLGAAGLEAGGHRAAVAAAGAEPSRSSGGPGADPARMSLSLQLPHDQDSVTLVRHLARQSLSDLGVRDAVIDDIELALSEACTNVLNHAGPGDSYEVGVAVRADGCEVRVVDRGRGFDYESVRDRQPQDDAERGRGLAIMEAVMDQVELVSEPQRGTLVRLVKRLEFDRHGGARSLLRSAAQQDAASSPLERTPQPER